MLRKKAAKPEPEDSAQAAKPADSGASPKRPKKPRKPLPKGAKIAIGVIAFSFIVAIIGTISDQNARGSNPSGGSSGSGSAAAYRTLDETIGDALATGSFGSGNVLERIDAATAVLKDAREEGLITGDILIDYAAATLSFTYANGTLGGIDLGEADNANPPMNVIRATSIEDWASQFAQDIPNIAKPQLMEGVGSSEPRIIDLCSFESGRRPVYQALSKRWSAMGLNATVKLDSSVADFLALDGYDIIQFSMHGTMLWGHPVLCLDDRTSAGEDDTYSHQLVTERSLARVWRESDQCMHYYVFPSFFTYAYDGNALDGAFVFAESCHFLGNDTDGRTEEFPQAFLAIGAASVSGMINSVASEYSLRFSLHAIEQLLAGKSVGSAFASAKQQFGGSDCEKGYKTATTASPAARPSLFGDSEATLGFAPKVSPDLAKWKAGYESFIRQGDYLDTAEFFTPTSMNDDTFPIEFGLHDMDGDGIPELIAYNGCEFEASARSYLYTFRNGAVAYVGEIGSGTIGSTTQHWWSANKDVTGLFRKSGRQDDLITWYYGFSGGKLTSTKVRVEDFVAGTSKDLTSDQKLIAASHNMKSVLATYTPARIESMGMDAFAAKAGF